MTLQASNLLTSSATWTWENWPIYCGGLPSNGLAPVQTNDGGVLAGYDTYWDPGTQPFPCQSWDAHAYRAGIKFDFTPWLHDLIEPNKFLITAKLRFNVSFLNGGDQCPAVVDMQTASIDWTGGVSDLIPGDEIFSSNITDQQTNETDLSSTVRRWLAFSDQGDNGFVFRQPYEDPSRDDTALGQTTCIADIHDVFLDLQYLPLSG